MDGPDLAAAREARRLDALRRLQILGSEPEFAFDDLVNLTATTCQVRIAFVAFVDHEQEWFKATIGLSGEAVAKAGSLGERVIAADGPVAVADVRSGSPAPHAAPLVETLGCGFAAVPVRFQGAAVGVLAVIDPQPREFMPEQLAALASLGRQVEQLLSLRATMAAREVDRDKAIERQTRFRSVLLALASGVIVHDIEGVIEDCNPAAEAIFGATRAEMLGTVAPGAGWVYEHQDGSPIDPEELPISITLKYGIDVRDVVMRVSNPSGTVHRWLFVNTSPLLDPQGRQRGAVTAFTDVTELVTLTNQLQESLAELAKATQERAALLSSVSHDIRAPLAAIRMMTEILEDRADAITETQRTELIRRVRAEARRTEGVLSDLVTANKVAPGLGAPRRRRVDLEQLVHGRVRELDAATHPVAIGLLEGDLTMWADPAQVERIIDNLINNAITHTPAGTKIVIEVVERDGNIEMAVDDNGPGVPDDIHSSMFSPYVRSGRSADRPGSGLGLFLVQQFALFHGGSTRYERSSRGGARFVVTLPRRPGQASAGVR